MGTPVPAGQPNGSGLSADSPKHCKHSPDGSWHCIQWLFLSPGSPTNENNNGKFRPLFLSQAQEHDSAHTESGSGFPGERSDQCRPPHATSPVSVHVREVTESHRLPGNSPLSAQYESRLLMHYWTCQHRFRPSRRRHSCFSDKAKKHPVSHSDALHKLPRLLRKVPTPYEYASHSAASILSEPHHKEMPGPLPSGYLRPSPEYAPGSTGDGRIWGQPDPF